MIVLLIVGILMGVAFSTQRGASKSVKRQDAIVAAHSLQKAVEAFRRDREGRVPSRLAGPSTPADWNGAQGPIDQDVNRPYMQAVWPQNVALSATRAFGGTATLGSFTPTTPTTLSVRYEAISASPDPMAIATAYRITVLDGAEVVCTIRNDQATGSESC